MTTNRANTLWYYDSGEEVRLGDRVEVRGWLGRKYTGCVSYIPGQSEPHPDLEYDDVRQWAITADDGTVYPILYDPENFQPPKKIKLVGRDFGRRTMPDDKLT